MNDGIPPDKVLTWFRKVLDGVEAAHKMGVWHRDLKPENFLCDPTACELVVADFGISHFAEPVLHTLVNIYPRERLANFTYAAPEQRTNNVVDYRADIYALGLILNEMYTATVPLGRLDEQEIRRFWTRLDNAAMEPQCRSALQLILITAQRSAEVLSAESQEIDVQAARWTTCTRREQIPAYAT